MAVAGVKFYRVRIDGDGVIVLRRPTDAESAKYLARVAHAGDDLEDAFMARIELADTLLVGVEDVEYIDDAGETKPLTPETDGWKAMIEAQWKIRAIIRCIDCRSAELDFRKKS